MKDVSGATGFSRTVGETTSLRAMRFLRSPRSVAWAIALLGGLGLAACSPDAGTEGTSQGGGQERAAVKARPSVVASPDSADARAIQVADRVMESLGGRKAWDDTRYISWNFFGRRRHYWDKWTNDLRVEKDSLIILVNIDTQVGRAQRAGVEITDPDELAQYMEMGYSWWVNDTYWMFMPYKLRDPGVNLAYLGERALDGGGIVDLLELTFDGVGLTPQNKYHVAVSRDTGLVVNWSFFNDRDDEKPRFTLPWADWQTFGKIKLATSHGQGADWDISVPASLPDDVFHAFAPVAS